MEWVKRQNDGDGDAYSILRDGYVAPEDRYDYEKVWAAFESRILDGKHASRFDCSTAYYPALEAVKAGDLEKARQIITDAGVFESTEQPPDWCYE